MKPHSDFKALKFFKITSKWDAIIFGFEINFMFFILYYTFRMVYQMFKQKLLFFYKFWNLVDLWIVTVRNSIFLISFYT